MEKLEKLKVTIDKWQNEISSVLENGGTIKIKKANDDFIIYKEMIKKIK